VQQIPLMQYLIEYLVYFNGIKGTLQSCHTNPSLFADSRLASNRTHKFQTELVPFICYMNHDTSLSPQMRFIR